MRVVKAAGKLRVHYGAWVSLGVVLRSHCHHLSCSKTPHEGMDYMVLCNALQGLGL